MNLQKATIESIGAITRNNSRDIKQLNIKITFYQRPYRWKETRIHDLFVDYIDNRKLAEKEKGDKEKAKEYFLGAVVLVEKRNEPNCCEYEVIDGQQRLTTIYLMNYLKFILSRVQIEELIKFNPSNIKIEMDNMIACYESFVGTKNGKKLRTCRDRIFSIIDEHGSAAWEDKERDSLLKQYRKAVGLPEKKDLTNEEVYYAECIEANKKFFQKEVFCLDYDCEEYKEGLREALSEIGVIYSDSRRVDWSLIECNEEEEWPYVNRAVNILNEIHDYYEQSAITDRPEELIKKYIGFLDELINKLYVCEIITKKSEDAYKLFETLNDRSESISDLELMKDYFYRYYVISSGEAKSKKNIVLKELDKKWADIYKNYDKDTRHLIAYCATVYITGKTNILQNDSLTDVINQYLISFTKNDKYSEEQIKKDFNIFETVYKIIKRLLNDDTNYIAYIVENDPNASIIKRELSLVMQLDYKAVTAAVICDIIFNYESVKKTIDFEEYLDDIFDDVKCADKYNTLWEEICIVWKATLLGADYEASKKFSDAIINTRNKKSIGISSSGTACIFLTANDEKKLKEEFLTWIGDWKYGKKPKLKQKIKYLFYELMLKYQYKEVADPSRDDELEFLATKAITFKEKFIKQELDHVEGKSIRGIESKCYMSDDIVSRNRDINGLGNMMILDKKTNIKKDHLPMQDAIKFYKDNCNAHRLIDEMESLFNKNQERNSKGEIVPTKEFFEKRSERLTEYFYAIVSNTDSTHKNVKIPKLKI
ncbi:DUF262 domain-containing protein [Pseudobutyrivibrio sp.]|uniref:DUF262 domain-containing protein n=1 Tax=Pseudobutyrivibrio sp. TaxID=2014367 RepID=UPI0038709C8D